jgi:hypothetical protein
MAGSGGNTLRAVLKELGWSRTRLVAELRRQRRGHPGGTESLVAVVSRWVNNHQQPSDFYRDPARPDPRAAPGGAVQRRGAEPQATP